MKRYALLLGFALAGCGTKPDDNAIGCWSSEGGAEYVFGGVRTEGCFCTSRVGHELSVEGELHFALEHCDVTIRSGADAETRDTDTPAPPSD